MIVTSLNRYERKKNIKLALDSYARFLKLKGSASGIAKDSVLVIAGGYDERLMENVEHFLELFKHAHKL